MHSEVLAKDLKRGDVIIAVGAKRVVNEVSRVSDDVSGAVLHYFIDIEGDIRLKVTPTETVLRVGKMEGTKPRLFELIPVTDIRVGDVLAWLDKARKALIYWRANR